MELEGPLDIQDASAEASPTRGDEGRLARRLSDSGRAAHPFPVATEPTSEPTDQERNKLAAVLTGIRDDLGFETASLFVQAAQGWTLLERQGPRRAWHAVLDPIALEGTPEAAQYPDVRALPGMGPRLAALGCASVATLPLPDGARLILDSKSPAASRGWVDRARPYLSLISIMSGPQWAARRNGEAGALRSDEEVASLQRAFSAAQSVLERQDAGTEDLLDSVRDSIRADELYLIVSRGARTEVLSSPLRPLTARLPNTIRVRAVGANGWGVEEGLLRRVAVSLGVSSRALAGGYGVEGEGLELAVAGWAQGPGLSPVSMTIVARALSTVRVALRTRRSALSSLMDGERARIAYALHDGLVQTVTGAVLELEALAKRIERDPQEALDTIDISKREIRSSLADLRAMLMNLSEEDRQKATSADVLRREVDDVVRRWRLPARVQVKGDLDDVPARVLSAAYVVIREALANAAKHAPGTNVTVALDAGATDFTVVVGDDGLGFTRGDEVTTPDSQHFGLEWLRRRVREAGGKLYVHPRPGKGTRVVARFPMHGEAS